MRNLPTRHPHTLVIFVLLLSLQGCSSYATRHDPAPVSTSIPEVVGPDSPEATEPATSVSSSTGHSLISRADMATAEGDYEYALALLERAQRIDPTNADVYLALVRTHLAKGDTRQARATAERGLLYCQNSTQCTQLRAFTRE